MNEELVAIAQVDKHDRTADAAYRRAMKQKKKLADCESSVTAAGERLLQLQNDRQENKKRMLSLQRDTATYEHHRAAALHMLETGLGDPDAAQHQYDSCGDQIDGFETQLLEAMERSDALDEAIEQATKAKAELEKQLSLLKESVPAEVKKESAIYKAEVAKRDQVLGEVERSMAARYRGFRKQNRWAVAPIEKGACTACQRVIRPQHSADIRRGLIKPCMGCHRWLTVSEQ